MTSAVHVIDFEKEVFARPMFSQYRDAFLQGNLNLAFCLQQSAPGDYEQNMTCASVSYKDTQAVKMVYQSNFSEPTPVDLGLTEPKPLREDLSIPAIYAGPSLQKGQTAVKAATLSAKVRSFHLEVKDAYNQNETPYKDQRYYRFYLYNGSFMDENAVRQVARGGETFCEIVVSQPKNLWGVETFIEIPAQDVSKVGAGGGGSTFCCGKDEQDMGLQRQKYWSSSIDVNPSYVEKPTGRTVISHFSCAKAGGNSGRQDAGVTAKDVYQHLRIMGQPIVAFYSDYPGYQAP